MNEAFRRSLSDILATALPEEISEEAIELKPFFGAVAGYVQGRLFVSRGSFGLALKLPLDLRTELLEHRGGTALRYFPKGHIKKAYVVIPGHILADSAALRGLLCQSMAFVHSLDG